MKIEAWRPIKHWNSELMLKLHSEQYEALATFCAAVSRDRRFMKAQGYAEVWQQGVRVELFSRELVEAITVGVREAPERLKDFLWAVRKVKKIDFYGSEEAQQTGWSLVETEYSMLDELDLSHQQREYASDLHYALAWNLGYALHHDSGHDVVCDPGFLVTIAAIAKRRIAAGRPSLPKRKVRG